MSDPYAAIAAPDPQATPPASDPQALETARSTVEHLVNTGATKDQIIAFMAAHGLAPGSDRIDAALAARDHGMKVHIPVQLVMPSAPASPADDPYAHLADPLQESSDPGADPLQAHGLGDQLGIGARNLLEGAAGLPDLVAAPLNMAVNGIAGTHLSTTPFQDLATSASDAMGLATPQTDEERLYSQMQKGGVGGLLTAPLGGEGAMAPIASALSGAGAGGASELARQNGAGPIGQLAAGILGGVLAPGVVAGGARVAQSLPGMAERELSPTMQAFERQNVPAMAADVGGVIPKVLTAGTNATLGTIPLHNAGEAAVAATKAARGNVAQSIGRVGDDLATGAAAQSGARSWVQASNDQAGRLYDAIPIAANTSAKLDNTRQALAQITRGLESNPELSAVMADPRMQRIARAITGETVEEPTGLLAADGSPITRTVQKGGALSWQDLKDFRSYVGEKAGAPALQSDTSQQNLKALYGALSDDMRATAQAQGPEAAVAFNRANSFWRKRQQTISDVIEPILGKDGNATGQDAFRQIQSWASNNGSFVRTAQLFKALPEEEANAVRASIFDRLGNSSAGRQDAAGEAFSPAEMLTQWNKLDPRVKNLLFGGQKYQQDIQDILTIAEAQKGAGKFANTSKTGLAMHAAPGLAMFHSIPTLALQYGAGWIMAHPALARWVASSVKKPNAAAQMAHIDRLTSLAASQPAIANDVLNLQSRLREALTQSPQPLAAQPQEQGQ